MYPSTAHTVEYCIDIRGLVEEVHRVDQARLPKPLVIRVLFIRLDYFSIALLLSLCECRRDQGLKVSVERNIKEQSRTAVGSYTINMDFLLCGEAVLTNQAKPRLANGLSFHRFTTVKLSII